MKKWIITSLFILLTITILIVINISGEKPLKDLKVKDIEKVEVFLQPPNIKKEVTDKEQIQKLVETLNRIVIYKKNNSWGNYNGQFVQYTITKKNGEIIKWGDYNPYIVLNGVGYKAKYQPCEELNALANKIIE